MSNSSRNSSRDRNESRPQSISRFFSSVNISNWSQFDQITLTGPRQIIFNKLLQLHWVTSLVYSVVLNVSIIIFTTLSIVYTWPTDSDALNGLIGGLIGVIIGLISGYFIQRLVHYLYVRGTGLQELAILHGVDLIL